MKKKVFTVLRKIKVLLPDWLIADIRELIDKKKIKQMRIKHMEIKPYEKGHYESGINLIGNIRSETGLGESMRILARVLKENNIPFVIVNVDAWANSDNGVSDWDEYIVDAPKYSVNVLHINAIYWAKCYTEFPAEWLDYRYNAAYWLWELETFPKRWQPCIETVDAIWAPSQFICDCFKKYTDKPVVHVPYAIWLKTPVKYTREHFNLPEDKFLYLLMYDFRSVSERKNPKGAVNAFKKAFSPEEANKKNIGIVLKINNAATGGEIKGLQRELEGYENIYFITDNLSRDEVESLEASVDVLLSLHRSEGFGLPMAESMFLGTPTVVTNWSANTEFADDKSACLVEGDLIPIDRQIGPYEKGNRWMDADLEMARTFIRNLYQDSEYYNRIKMNGQKIVKKKLSFDTSGHVIQSELEALEL